MTMARLHSAEMISDQNWVKRQKIFTWGSKELSHSFENTVITIRVRVRMRQIDVGSEVRMHLS